MTDQPITAGDVAVSPDLDPAGHRPTREEIALAVETSEEMNAADETYVAALAATGDEPADDAEAVHTPVAVDDAPEPAQVEQPADVEQARDEQAEDVAAAADATAVADEVDVEIAADDDDVEAAEAVEAAVEIADSTDDAVIQDAQSDEAPTEEVADGPAPADGPAAEASTDEAPTDQAPTDEAPAHGAPIDEGTTDEAAADEALADEATAEEAAPESAPHEAAPADEAPADQAPADQPSAEHHSADARPGRPRPGAPGRPGGGRPSPIPRRAPVAGNHPPTLPLVQDSLVESSDPTPWGRVDTDGTVFVTTADGERAVGFWQAGDAAAGLAHYGRRFDDFVVEIVVLETRVATHSGDLKATKSHATMLRQSVDTLPAVGDLAGAAARLDAVVVNAELAMSAAAQDRAAARADALARREALCTEAEQIAESSQWKTSGDRLKEIVEEWRTIRGLDRRTDDQLWKRFSKARDTFIRRRGSHFAEMDKERAAVREVKEKLITRAEELADSTEWGETASKYRDLMAEWKAAGRTSRDLEDALWMRFRDAQEKFFSRRQQTFASRDAEYETNAHVREDLLSEAEKIDPTKDLEAAKSALRSLQSRWEDTGKVPRERIRSLDTRLRAVEDRVKSAEDSHWRKTDPEATARLAQFRTRYETYQAQADKAKATGDPRRAAAAQAQADQWLEWLKAAENAVE